VYQEVLEEVVEKQQLLALEMLDVTHLQKETQVEDHLDQAVEVEVVLVELEHQVLVVLVEQVVLDQVVGQVIVL
jgi:hypothetical protein